MNHFLLVVIAGAFLGVEIDAADETYRCPHTVKVNRFVRTFGESCYEFITQEKSYYRARNDCASRRGHLVTIKNIATQQFLFNILRYDLHWPKNGLWIGASDEHREGDWRWITGHSVSSGYTNWDSGQPSCLLLGLICFEHCAQMRLDKGGKWHDYQCDYPLDDYSYICEYPLGPKSTTRQPTITTTATSTANPSTATTISISASTLRTTSASPLMTNTANQTVALMTNTANPTVLVRQIPDIGVVMLGKSQMSQMGVTEDHGSSIGMIVGLALGLLCGLAAGLCIGVFFLRRKHRQDKEDLPSVFFSNPYYADACSPLNPPPPPPRDYDEDDACCTSYSQASTPVKRQLNRLHIVPAQREAYRTPSSLAALSAQPWMGKATNDYDEFTAHKLLYADARCAQYAGEGEEELEGATGGVYEDTELVDTHYDIITGENFYESVDNVRLAIQENALNERQEEERYVPFQFDGPDPVATSNN